MSVPDCTHLEVRQRLEAGDPEGALRLAGAMLEGEPGDTAAWRFCALALAGMGRERVAAQNLRSLAVALAEERNPILGIALARQLAALGGSDEEPIGKIAKLYALGSPRVADDVALSPPPLPPPAVTAPWPAELAGEALADRAADVMAVAWGAALTRAEAQDRLPFVPLLSALEPRDFVELARCLEPVTAGPGARVVEQGATGEAMYIVAEGRVTVNRIGSDGERQLLARLGPGAFFGEMALVSRAARAAEVRAEDRVLLLEAHRDRLEALARRVPAVGDVLVAFCHARMLENLMRVSPVLAPVPPARRPAVIARFSTDYRRAGEAIVKEGTEGPGLHLVVSGSVRVTRREGGEVLQVARLGPGDLFGEISLLMRKPATATVATTEDAALLVLSRDDFHDVTRDFPELLKGAYDIAVARDEQNNSILAAPAIEIDDPVMV
jgi:cAMP-dependent protein kinase regulator